MGNWTPGQALSHLAQWVDYAYSPAPVRMPLVLGWILRLLRKRFLTKGLPPGVRISGVKCGTLGIEPATVDEGLERYARALARLRDQSTTQKHAVFGALNHAQWILLTLRHAELHLGFFTPRAAGTFDPEH